MPAPEPPVRVTLAAAVLKSEYMEEAIRDAAMVGVTAIQPLRTAHSVSAGRSARMEGLVPRWRRIALASARQCGRAVVPDVAEPRELTPWLGSLGPEGVKLLLVEPALAVPAPVDLGALLADGRAGGALLLVGPEGGWAPAEIAEARAAGFIPWTLSPRTLRADAMAVAALAVLLHAWERGGAGSAGGDA